MKAKRWVLLGVTGFIVVGAGLTAAHYLRSKTSGPLVKTTCTDSTVTAALQKTPTLFDEKQAMLLKQLADSILKTQYDKTPSCTYVVTYNYVQTGDELHAQSTYAALTAQTDPYDSYVKVIGQKAWPLVTFKQVIDRLQTDAERTKSNGKELPIL